MAERKKLAIIDGKSVFYRGFYAMPNLSTKDGTLTGGVYGFTAMALELIKKLKPDYVCVAWDKPKTNIRSRLKIYPQYKAGRKPAPPDFYVQIPILHELLRAFNWPLYELDDYEADDIMCGLAKKAAKAGIETMLITSDLDALQCVGPLTHVYALKKGFSNIEKYEPESFTVKYGLEPEQFLDLKSLQGDSSDNIPGVPGIGQKTAIELLQQYKTLDGVYDNLALVKDSVRRKLEAGRESATMSKEIARLYDDAPIELDLEQMDVAKLDVNELQQILQRLEFRSLLRQLPEVMQVKGEQAFMPTGSNKDLRMPKTHLVASAKDAECIKLTGEDIVLHARAAGKHGSDPTAVILADKQNCYVIDLRKFDSAKAVKALSPQLTAHSSVIGHDLKNSFKVLLELGTTELPAVGHDTLVGSFIINSLERARSLSEQALQALGMQTDLDNLDDDQLVERAGEIAAIIRALAAHQGEQMSEVTSLIKLAERVDWPVIPVLARMERAGIKIDPKFFAKLSVELGDKISDIEQTIYGFADHEFNISSPQQLSDILFVKLNLPTAGVKKGKTGSFSTAADVLDKLKDLHPIINCIEQYREFTKLKSTYVDTLPTMADGHDRIHTTFNLTIAATGRLSSVDPNLQNIPVRTELGREIRKGFIAEPGNVLVSADYSQFELRIAAAMAGDESMIEAFNSGRDIHVETAALIQGVKPEDVTKQMRYAAKAVNFGILYGQGVHGLSAGTGISYAEAKEFIDKYFEVRPKLRAMIDTFRDQAVSRGYVETLLGRRRPTPDATSSNYMVREGALRAAINMPIQGGAADLTKLAMIKLQEQFDGKWGVVNSRLGNTPDTNYQPPTSITVPRQLLQIHDSIMVECRSEDAEAVGKIMKEAMESIYPELGVNLRVDVAIGKTWGDL